MANNEDALLIALENLRRKKKMQDDSEARNVNININLSLDGNKEEQTTVIPSPSG